MAYRILRFELQFPAAEIEQLAARFSYEDDVRCQAAGTAARARGNYTRDELLVVCRWKTLRSASKVAANSSRTVASASRAVFTASDEADRMSSLINLSGVGVPTASALLMFAFPDDYPILDVRALESLGVTQPRQYPIAFWLAYLAGCRELARRHNVHIRTLDKALWQHSKERSIRAHAATSGRHLPTRSSEPAPPDRGDMIGQAWFPKRDVYDRALVSKEEEGGQVVIDRLRKQIQERLDQIAGEADRLRKALAALDPRSSKAPARKPPARRPAQSAATKPSESSATKPPPPPPASSPAAPSRRRTAPGATKAAVLAALAGAEAMTAGQVAEKTGLARGTVSTTLSKLANSGEVQKAQRGYRLATTASATPSPPAE